MELNSIVPGNLTIPVNAISSIPPIPTFSYQHFASLWFPPLKTQNPFSTTRNESRAVRAKKKSLKSEPVLKPTIVEEVDDDVDEEEQLLFDEFEDDSLMGGEDDDLEKEFLEDDEETELRVGDGGAGGGIALAGTWWDREALGMAEEVCLSFDSELGIYAFRTLSNSSIQVRIERLTNKSGSPSMEDIEAFSTTYRARLDQAELAKTIPDNTTLEISSPGVERVVQIPEELDRFKERPMYVKYVSEEAATESTSESDGVFRLISFDMESKTCTWGVADVRINREKAGKGRPLSKKQREWRLDTPFHSLRLVRLYSEI